MYIIYKTHSLKRTDAGGNGLWQGWRTYNWDWQKIDHDGKKCFRNPFFFLESDIKIDVYIYNYIYIASLDGFQKSIFPNNYLYTMGDLKLWIFLNLIIALKPGSDEIRFRN